MDHLPLNGSTARRRGRRPAGEDTKKALLEAATEVFAEQGFEGATMRTIAARAGTDPAMVYHWFDGKQALFSAIIELPFDIARSINDALAGDRETLGERFVRTFVTVWDGHRDRFAAIVHSAASQEVATAVIREFLATTVFDALTEVIDLDRAEYRAALCGSQLIGLAMMRYVLRLDPLAHADVEDVVGALAPTVQRYLTQDL